MSASYLQNIARPAEKFPVNLSREQIFKLKKMVSIFNIFLVDKILLSIEGAGLKSQAGTFIFLKRKKQPNT